MRVIPYSTTRFLSECDAGALVRWHGASDDGSALAFIGEFEGDNKKCLIHLSNEPNVLALPYLSQPAADIIVVNYGREYCIEIDHSANIDFHGTSRYKNGMVILCDDKIYLVVASSRGVGYGTSYFDIESGKFVDQPNPMRSVSFGSWRLNLNIEAIDDYTCNPVAYFEVKTEFE